ncbi:hypothetical protein SAMN04489737_0263 [Arcanobacterium phocae]|uniref:Uncharacterized protein n=1 Tax=Arcanobacterium phocae TaxID=131112 RepID=A0A1H2LBN6_9ACTO|nr:hypothetical protein SAMN04489737_0263 [Arcanobacterium phocae]
MHIVAISALRRVFVTAGKNAELAAGRCEADRRRPAAPARLRAPAPPGHLLPEYAKLEACMKIFYRLTPWHSITLT